MDFNELINDCLRDNDPVRLLQEGEIGQLRTQGAAVFILAVGDHTDEDDGLHRASWLDLSAF